MHLSIRKLLHIRTGFCLALAGIPLVVRATLSLHAPFDDRVPFYFTGTNCKVKCTALALTGSPRIARANLWIGGTIVAKYDPAPPGEGEMPQSLASWAPEVTFSSLAFSHGTYPVVMIEAQDTSGAWFSASYCARVHNLGMVYGLREFETSNDVRWHGCPNSVSGLSDLGHSVPSALIAYLTPWSRDNFFDSLSIATALYVNSHGWDDPSRFRCDNELSVEQKDRIYPTIAEAQLAMTSPPAMVLERRAAVTGIDDLVPPFNTTQGVPMSFVFMDWCTSGSSPDWTAFILQGAMTSPNQELVKREAEDTAVLGWLRLAKASWAQQDTSILWTDLSIGLTVTEARHDIVVNLPPAEVAECTGQPGPWADQQVMTIAPQGLSHDFTRLGYYVYTGTLFLAPHLWYK